MHKSKSQGHRTFSNTIDTNQFSIQSKTKDVSLRTSSKRWSPNKFEKAKLLEIENSNEALLKRMVNIVNVSYKFILIF